ncbi:NUDIX hydrolase [Alkalicoccus daliensis]|uniref:ADP-ribose pyrophosphatase YjhB, NUDIX family n=1 Tax=Alkalicoccus daliensis TaxID=745820 RepID=A0A1H0CKH1_9BACI|nr:NUDIX domain-containing protein [Alkalicoccus daliensis]SDN58366.1 ADP-ribose pyrophosphatase YjhB, NUDIX family [Alkalicoccus daliensis]
MSYFENMRKHVGKEPLLLPGAAVIIHTAENDILLQKRNDGHWGLPGGLMELGESYLETALRETEEETGVKLPEEEMHLFGVFSGKDYYVEAPNGDPYYAVTGLYTCKDPGQPLNDADEETLELRYFPITALPQELRPSHKHFLALFDKHGEQRGLLDK